MNHPLRENFSTGQWVVINDLGYPPYALGELKVTNLSFSTVVVEMHYIHGGKKAVEHNIHIPYEHLKR